ncbi:N/A [soil metagenome]
MIGTKEIKILLVEDDEDDYIIFKDYLSDIKSGNYQLTWSSTFESGLANIQKREHDIYFFDCILGKNNGLDLIKACVSNNIDVPVIFLTGLGNHETDIAAMELGAMDFLMKDEIDAGKLERSIRYSIDQSKSLQKIKVSEEKFRSIFENSQDVIYLADSTGKIHDINLAAEKLLGYSRDELIQMNEVELFENPLDHKLFLQSIALNGNSANSEVILKDKYNNRKYSTVTTSIQKVDEHNIIFYQAIIHDITKRRKVELDLQIAEKLAVSGRLARSLAHEIRNPLTNINLSVEQLEEYIPDEAYNSYFEIIKRNSKRINDLVTELMEHAKPTELKSSRVAIQTILNKTVTLAKDRAALKNIKIETIFSGENEEIEGDESKLSIALLNIIVNAIEAVEANHGHIRIFSECKEKRCIILIEDNGVGIKPNDLDKIFDPYFTAKNNGVGLGLATTHSIIYSHKGTIDVESIPKKGTKFSITLNLL